MGGYCLPNALYYLLPKAEEMGLELPLLKTARRINDSVPAFVAGLALKNLDVPPREAHLAVLGIAMKDYSNDDRISPAREVISHLQAAGCTVRAYDPAVPSVYPYNVESLEKAVRGAHGILVLARQNGIDYHNLALFKEPGGRKPFILDTKISMNGRRSSPTA